MKKSLLIITSFILMCIMFIGCAQTDATITTSKELNKNLNMLSNTVKRLDTIDNEYLMDNELYSLGNISSTPTPHKTTQTLIANSSNVIIEENNINDKENKLQDELRSALTDEIISRLYCDENGNCKLCKEEFICDNDGICNSCNETIICDEFGNCTDCKSSLDFNDKNECSNCNKKFISKDNKIQLPSNTITKLNKISNINNELKVNKLSLLNNDNIEDINNNVIDNNNELVNNVNNVYDSNSTLNSSLDTLKEQHIFEDSDVKNEDYLNQNNLTTQTNNQNLEEKTIDYNQENNQKFPLVSIIVHSTVY